MGSERTVILQSLHEGNDKRSSWASAEAKEKSPGILKNPYTSFGNGGID